VLDFERDGACILDAAPELSDIRLLRDEFAHLDFRAGSRNFDLSEVTRRQLSPQGAFGSSLAILGKTGSRPVRVLAFDKTPVSNWNLGWHQDRVIAVKDRSDVAGFENWTVKNGVHHVQPPAEFMAQLFTLRLHLDDCCAENGALKVIPGSHRLGKLLDAQVQKLAETSNWKYCEAKTGEILAMKTLAIHSSSPAQNPSHRRVLHVDYCEAELPEGLEWALDFPSL
jgi:Phytanoyl-CoA dioxygenase (PhyH)